MESGRSVRGCAWAFDAKLCTGTYRWLHALAHDHLHSLLRLLFIEVSQTLILGLHLWQLSLFLAALSNESQWVFQGNVVYDGKLRLKVLRDNITIGFHNHWRSKQHIIEVLLPLYAFDESLPFVVCLFELVLDWNRKHVFPLKGNILFLQLSDEVVASLIEWIDRTDPMFQMLLPLV